MAGCAPLATRTVPQTRCVRCLPDGRGYAVASVEGRVAVDYFDDAESAASKYAFKCHRRVEGGKDVVYPVNAIGARWLLTCMRS
jgi:cell cycle arrest protein BUB3